MNTVMAPVFRCTAKTARGFKPHVAEVEAPAAVPAPNTVETIACRKLTYRNNLVKLISFISW